MATLNSIAENIAFSLGEQFNDTLMESIKDSIIDYRALLIRQDLENNPLSYTDYLQSFCIELEEVDKSECPLIKTNKNVLRSKQAIPKPLRLKYNGRINFKFVGSVDRSISLTFATAHELQYVIDLPFQQNVIYYTMTNGKLIVLNNLKLCKLLIEEVIADPRKIDDCDYPETFKDDIEFPIPEDFLPKIKQFIRKDYPQYITDGAEINIEPDGRS